MEGEFTNNIHTARGNAEHEKVDGIHHETHSDRRSETALPVWSDRVGLIGKCDVVEFLADGTPYPVEYKHGPKRKWLNDDLQLAAQAMCLEDMLGRPVPKGAIFHASSHRRREVFITPELRARVIDTANAIRAMLASGVLPPPVNDSRCRECSLKEICQPEAVADRIRQRQQQHRLFDPEA
ncbi:MAG: CRISPR-associated protein Cas4 [Thiobacillus sp.]|nr:CRISPR-associated protein Cas4 [Thiobacillus sp.]